MKGFRVSKGRTRRLYLTLLLIFLFSFVLGLRIDHIKPLIYTLICLYLAYDCKGSGPWELEAVLRLISQGVVAGSEAFRNRVRWLLAYTNPYS